jgi:hypothetical protein
MHDKANCSNEAKNHRRLAVNAKLILNRDEKWEEQLWTDP